MGKADEIPLSFDCGQTSQKETPYASVFLDLTENRLDALFSLGVDLLPRFCLEFAQCSVHRGQVVGNSPQRTRTWWVAVFFTLTRDKRFRESVSYRFHGFFSEIPGIGERVVGISPRFSSICSSIGTSCRLSLACCVTSAATIT